MIFFCFFTGFHLWATGEVKSLLLLQVNKTWNKWIERKIKWRKKREKMAKLTKAKVTGCLKSSALTLATLIGVIGGVIFGLCLRQRERKWWGTVGYFSQFSFNKGAFIKGLFDERGVMSYDATHNRIISISQWALHVQLNPQMLMLALKVTHSSQCCLEPRV